MMWLGQSYDTELPEELRARVSENALHAGGASTMIVGSAEYVRIRESVQMSGNASSAFRYYQPAGRSAPVGHNLNFGVQARLPATLNLRIDAAGSYSPSFLSQLFTGTPTAIAEETTSATPDYRIDQSQSYTYSSRVALTRGGSRGIQLTATGEYSQTDFQNELNARDLTFYSGSAGAATATSRNTRLSVEYIRRESQFGVVGKTTEDRVRVGFQYSRSLWGSRRAVLHLNVSPSTLEVPVIVDGSNVPGRLQAIQTDVAIEHPFRWNWRARAAYRRGLEYIAILGQPMWTDGATLGASSLLTRRIDFSLSADYSNGNSALFRDQLNLDTYSGALRLRFALARAVALQGDYLYYRYELRNQQAVGSTLPSRVGHHSAGVGLTFWVPAVSR
jgi:hypothetical protein